MDKTRLLTTGVIFIAVAVIVVAFTPLRWLFVEEHGVQANSVADGLVSLDSESTDDNESTDQKLADETGDANTEKVATLIKDIEALIEAIESPPEEITTNAVSDLLETTDQNVTIQAQQAALVAKRNILVFIELWRKSWELGNVKSHLQGYSQNFQPANNVSRDLWQSKKLNQIDPSRQISVILSDIQLALDSNNQMVTAFFEQELTIDGVYSWSKKQLKLLLEGGQWRIVSESNID